MCAHPVLLSPGRTGSHESNMLKVEWLGVQRTWPLRRANLLQGMWWVGVREVLHAYLTVSTSGWEWGLVEKRGLDYFSTWSRSCAMARRWICILESPSTSSLSYSPDSQLLSGLDLLILLVFITDPTLFPLCSAFWECPNAWDGLMTSRMSWSHQPFKTKQNNRLYGKARGQPGVLVIFPVCMGWDSLSESVWESPVSASHLTIGTLGSQLCSGFTWATVTWV